MRIEVNLKHSPHTKLQQRHFPGGGKCGFYLDCCKQQPRHRTLKLPNSTTASSSLPVLCLSIPQNSSSLFTLWGLSPSHKNKQVSAGRRSQGRDIHASYKSWQNFKCQVTVDNCSSWFNCLIYPNSLHRASADERDCRFLGWWSFFPAITSELLSCVPDVPCASSFMRNEQKTLLVFPASTTPWRGLSRICFPEIIPCDYHFHGYFTDQDHTLILLSMHSTWYLFKMSGLFHSYPGLFHLQHN